MPTPNMSGIEIIDYLKKTQLPTVLVEGTDDASIFRWMENRLGIFNASFLSCTGRDVLIDVYTQRHLFPTAKLAWIADLDMWRYSSLPSSLSGIIFTKGYSIENDLYEDSAIESLFEPAEQQVFKRLLQLVSRWFAFEIEEHKSGRPHHVATHISQVLDEKHSNLNMDFLVFRNFSEPPKQLVDLLLEDYKLSLRGKTLLQIVVHVLSHPRRQSKYSRTSLLEMCLKMPPENANLNRILQQVKAVLDS